MVHEFTGFKHEVSSLNRQVANTLVEMDGLGNVTQFGQLLE